MLRKFFYIAIAAILFSSLTIAQQYYAVLITGDTPEGYAQSPKSYNGGGYSGFDEFWNDTYLMWKLLHENGFEADHIYTLYGNGYNYPSQNPRYQPDAPITKFPAYYSNVQNIFTWLANGNTEHNIPKMTNNDVLFIWTFDHGTISGGNAGLCLMDGVIWDYDFASYVNQIACQKRIILMQQCFSGGFIDNLQSSKTVMLTACSGTEVAYRADDVSPDGSDSRENEIYNGSYYHHGEFNYHVINAFFSKTIVGNPISSDSDNNGGVSTLESKTWEFNRDSRFAAGVSHPQWSDQGNLGFASFVYRLLDLAYTNKSTNYYAGYNNAHLIERGYSGKLHEVFNSGGEIFYRRSSNNGSSWELTTRLSSGNGLNNHPSIVAGYSDVLCAVWQKEIDSRHYSIWSSFSSNMGSSWTTPVIVPGCSNVWISYYQSRDDYGPGPTPVVGSYFRGGSEGTPSFLLVYAAENGLHYRTASSYSTGWATPADDIVLGSGGSSSTNWYPSLASYNSQAYTVNLTYDNRFNHVYSQIFYYDDYPTAWSSRVQVSLSGTDNNRLSSIAVDYLGNTLAAWSGWNGSNYSVKFRQGFANGTWSTWSKTWTISGVECYTPAITYYNKGGMNPYGVDILWYTSSQQIRQKKYGGYLDVWVPADPNTQFLASNGLCANLTHERQNTSVPIQTWTDQATSPIYSIIYNSLYLPKETILASGEIRRAAVIGDTSNNSGLSVELSQPVVKLNNDQSMTVPFKEYDYTAKLDLSLSNIFDYLQTEALAISDNAESISFNVEVKSTQPDTLADGSVNKNIETPFNDISFELFAIDNTSNVELISAASQSLNSSSGIHDFIQRYTFNSQSLKGKEIYFLPKVNLGGSFKSDNLRFGLVNVSIEELSSLVKDSTIISSSNQLPLDYYLDQNYPNPFNPQTNIQFAIPQSGFVTLKVYDILGREVTTLVNEFKNKGRYTITFDASNLTSGVYFLSITASDFNQTKKMILAK